MNGVPLFILSKLCCFFLAMMFFSFYGSSDLYFGFYYFVVCVYFCLILLDTEFCILCSVCNVSFYSLSHLGWFNCTR